VCTGGAFQKSWQSLATNPAVRKHLYRVQQTHAGAITTTI